MSSIDPTLAGALSDGMPTDDGNSRAGQTGRNQRDQDVARSSDGVVADYSSQPVEEPIWAGLPASAWMKIGAVAILFGALFWPNLRRLWEKTNPIDGDANWGHAICIPFVGMYYLYINRDELLAAAAKSKPTISGLLIMVLGILVFGYGIWPGQNDFTKDFGMVMTLFGVTLMLAGWSVMRIAWFPIAFLVCGIPWPGLVYSQIAGPLQQLAAQVAVATLSMTGVKSFASGTKIFIYGHGGALRTLNVAEACAGLRSLMTFISVAAAIAFLSARPLWEKVVITLSAIPIAIFCNVMRVSGQGLLDHYVSQQLSESFAHQFVGMIMLIPAFFLILGVGWVVDQLVVDEMDVKKTAAPQVLRRGATPMATRVAPVENPVAPIARRAPLQRPAPIATPTPKAAPAPSAKPAAIAKTALATNPALKPTPAAPQIPPAQAPALPAQTPAPQAQPAMPPARKYVTPARALTPQEITARRRGNPQEGKP